MSYTEGAPSMNLSDKVFRMRLVRACSLLGGRLSRCGIRMATGGAVAFLCAAAVAIPSASLAADVAPSAAPADAAATPVPPVTGPDDKGNPAPPEPRSWDEVESKPDNAERMSWAVRRDPDLERVMSEAKAFMADGRVSDTIVLLQEMLDNAGTSVVQVGPNLFRSPRLAAEDILAKFPSDALKTYRILADPSAQGLLPQGRNSAEDALCAVAYRFFYSSLGDDAAVGYASRALNRGENHVALEWLEKVLNRHPDPDVPRWELLSKLCLAAAGADNRAAALRYGEACLAPETGLPEMVRRGIEAQLAALRTGATSAAAIATGTYRHTEFVPEASSSGARTVWVKAWTSTTRGRRDLFGGDVGVIRAELYGVPGSRILAVGSNLLVRACGNLIAFDAQSGTERWRVEDPWLIDNQRGRRMVFESLADYMIGAEGSRIYSLECVAKAIEDVAKAIEDIDGKRAPGSAVVARDIETGRRIWRVGLTEDTKDPLYATRFLCAPVGIGDRLFTVGIGTSEVAIVELSAKDGSFVARCPFAAVSANRRSQAAALCANAGRLVVLAEEAGIVSAVSTDRDQLLWSARYRTTADSTADMERAARSFEADVNRHRHRNSRFTEFIDPPQPRLPWAENRLWAGNGLVLACPRDSSFLVAIDLLGGDIRYELDLVDPVSLIGVADGYAYVARRTGVTAIEAATGRTVWDTPIPTTPARGAFVGDSIYVPCMDRVVELDRRTGVSTRLLFLDVGQDQQFGNLTFAGTGLYSATVLGVAAFEALATAPATGRTRDDPAGWRTTLAALDAVDARGDLDGKRRTLVRTALFETLCEAVKSQVDDPAWQVRIQSLAATPDQRARADYALACRIARTAPRPEVALRLAEKAVKSGDALVTANEDVRRVQSRLAIGGLFRSALTQADAKDRSTVEDLAAERLKELVAADAPVVEYRALAEALPGTDGAIASASRAAEAYRKNGEFALAEAVLLNALSETTPDRIARVTTELAAHYAAAGWSETASNAVAVGVELSAAAQRYPGTPVPVLLGMRRQRLDMYRPMPEFRWREKGSFDPGRNAILLDFPNPWGSPFLTTNVLYVGNNGSNLVCMALDSLKPVWSLPAETGRFSPWTGRLSSHAHTEIVPPVHGHIAVLAEYRGIPAKCGIVGIDLLRGRRLWTYTPGAENPGLFPGNTPLLEVVNGRCFIMDGDSIGNAVICAVDVLDGSVLWKHSIRSMGAISGTGDAGLSLFCLLHGRQSHTTFVDAWDGSSRVGPRREMPKPYVCNNEKPLLSPAGLLIMNTFFQTSPIDDYLAFFPFDPAKGSNWSDVVNTRIAHLYPLNDDAALIECRGRLESRRLSDGRRLWDWGEEGSSIARVFPEDPGGRHFIVLVNKNDAAQNGSRVFRIDSETGKATEIVYVPAVDPRMCGVPLFTSIGSGVLVQKECLSRPNRPASENVWTIRGYSLSDGTVLKDRITGVDGATCSSLSVRDSSPDLVVRGRHVLLHTTAQHGIRVFESQGERQ